MSASVRMGEMHISSGSGEELVAIGLGSCIGLALIDRAAGVAGLAHVVLPESGGAAGPPGKFADLAVPELLNRVQQAGARKERLEAVIVGGAKMFALGAGMDIGARNEAAVREALGAHRLRVRAAATGGNSGRTMRVVGSSVNVHEAGSKPVTLFGDGAGGAGSPSSGAGRVGSGSTSLGAGRLRAAGAEA
jgi:chemotaxis protein CheD